MVSSHYFLSREGACGVMLLLPVGNVFNQLSCSACNAITMLMPSAITVIFLAFKRREKTTSFFNNECAA